MRIAELGAGDGTLLLRVARAAASTARPTTVWLVDRAPVAGPAAMQRFAAAGWPAESVVADAFDWLSRDGSKVDIMVCNLFLHHFDSPQLRELLSLIARRASLLVACEPARTRLAMTGSSLLGLIGCNDVTRHDAVTSVAAGFRDGELSALWPEQSGWRLEEGRAGLFSHGFIAARRMAG